MLASKRSAGKPVTLQDKSYVVEELTEESLMDSISKHFGPIAVEKGKEPSWWITGSFECLTLVIPEVNPEAMVGIKVGLGKGALIANPNCSTIICLMAATPLHRQAERRLHDAWSLAHTRQLAGLVLLQWKTLSYKLESLARCYKENKTSNM